MVVWFELSRPQFWRHNLPVIDAFFVSGLFLAIRCWDPLRSGILVLSCVKRQKERAQPTSQPCLGLGHDYRVVVERILLMWGGALLDIVLGMSVTWSPVRRMTVNEAPHPCLPPSEPLF